MTDAAVAAVRSILGDYVSEARCREVVVAVLGAVREPSNGAMMRAAPDATHLLGRGSDWDERFRAAFAIDRHVKRQHFTDVIDALIEEVTAG